jgi:hypothetical protein
MARKDRWEDRKRWSGCAVGIRTRCVDGFSPPSLTVTLVVVGVVVIRGRDERGREVNESRRFVPQWHPQDSPL